MYNDDIYLDGRECPNCGSPDMILVSGDIYQCRDCGNLVTEDGEEF